MSSPLTVYAEALRDHVGGTGAKTVIRFRDGTTRLASVDRWVDEADDVDECVLAALPGPVLDVGCGPGRHLHALARRGVFGLGVDICDVAVDLARGAGANAMVGSIFGDVPGAGRWRSALLLDGNIGIGGRPARLLRRVTELLAPGAMLLVELAAPRRRLLQLWHGSNGRPRQATGSHGPRSPRPRSTRWPTTQVSSHLAAGQRGAGGSPCCTHAERKATQS